MLSGIPSSLPPGGPLIGSGPLPSETVDILPITAYMITEYEKLNRRTIIIISVSSVVLLLALVGAFAFVLKLRNIKRPSSVVDHAFTSYLNKRSGIPLNFTMYFTFFMK